MATSPIRRVETDPTLAEPTKSEQGDVLTQMMEDLKKNKIKAKPPIVLPVKTRQRVEIRYSTVLDGDKFQAWLRRCTDSQQRLDGMKFAKMVIANQAEQIIWNGQEPKDPENGGNLNFGSDTLIEMLGALDVQGAVEVMFGDDSLILATSQVVTESAGYGSDPDLDPTLTTSTRSQSEGNL